MKNNILSFEEFVNEKRIAYETELQESACKEEDEDVKEEDEEDEAEEAEEAEAKEAKSENDMNEKDVTNEKDFREWAEAYLKQAHGDDYDEKIANDTIEGVMKKYKDDWGAMIGAVKA